MVDCEVFMPVIKYLIKYYYEKDGNSTGGNLHIALDDGNLEDENLWFCQEKCEENNDWLGNLIATTLRHFTTKEREEMYDDNWWGMR